MANNQYVNKVQFGNNVLIDLTNDTVTEDKILAGYTAHDATGASITGTCVGVHLPVPVTGINSFYIAVPNGTNNPNPFNSNDWIIFNFRVDSLGNSEITEGT